MSGAKGCHCGAQPPCKYVVAATFHRLIDGKPFFYPVMGTPCEDWAEHAALNPGTICIDRADNGARLWPTPRDGDLTGV